MTENELFALVGATLTAGLGRLAPGLAVDVRQAYNPRQVGRPGGPAVLLSKTGSRRYGSMQRRDFWDTTAAPPVEKHIESQQMQVMLQANALYPLPTQPQEIPDMTAGDLLGLASAVLQSSAGLAQLRGAGVGIERITELRHPYFTSDREAFEASPSFDFTLDFTWTITTTTPIIEEVDLVILRV